MFFNVCTAAEAPNEFKGIAIALTSHPTSGAFNQFAAVAQ